ATLRIAKAAQAIDEGEVHALLRTQRQECDAGAGVGRAGGQRQRKHHARKRRHASSPTHSITSSARARSVGGTVIPNALAVLRLTARNIFVGNSIGRSPGAVPRRILSTK